MLSEIYKAEIKQDNGVISYEVIPSVPCIQVKREFISEDFEKMIWRISIDKDSKKELEKHFTGATLQFLNSLLAG